MLLTRPLQAFGAIFGHKPSTKRSIEQKSSKNYLGGNIYPAPNQQLDWYIIQLDEQKMIASLTQDELNPVSFETGFEPITAEELAAVFGIGTTNGENFLRTAVMVALADGTYSLSEDEVLYNFCTALGHNVEAIESLRHTIEDSSDRPPESSSQTAVDYAATPLSSGLHKPHHKNVLQPVKDWLDGWEVHDPRVARFVCKMIPPQCPFERDVVLFGRKIVHIPAMCKINPLYEQLVGMRFRALCYLADDCKEDVSTYC
ncbi:MAG: Mo-dependent nitrogenase [Oscillatoriales cyanobacterium]|nr:MAG: Mo-dependent nitrogenase [Oscillatoriales cyanobacterium]